MDHLELFTDGGAIKIGNTFYGSSACVIRYKEKYFTFTNQVNEGTNNYFELKAIRDGLKAIASNWRSLDGIEVWIVSDSQYSISCITEWFDGWSKIKGKYYNKSGKEVSNIDLILEIREILSHIPNYRFVKIKSHIDVDIQKSFIEFKKKNCIDISYTEYLLLVRYNETCDNKIRAALNIKRRDIARELGQEVVV